MSNQLTLYKGFYYDTRKGIKMGIHFTYNIDPSSRTMINEREIKVVPQTHN